MTWSYWLCDTITGAKLLRVEPESGSWARRLNMAESGQHSFVLNDPAARDLWTNITAPWSRTFVQCWDDEPVYAGLITGTPYDFDSQTLTVRHVDFRAILLARFPFGEDSYWVDQIEFGEIGSLTITNKSLVSAAGLVVEQGLIGPPGEANYSLPVVLPSLVESGTFSTVYNNYNLQRVSDILDELQEMDGGPDIEFAPRWTANALEWVMRAGALTGNEFEFNLSAGKSPASSYKVNIDGLKQVTGVFGVGQGYGTNLVIGGTPGADPYIIPARDDLSLWKMVKTNAHATALAYERIARYRNPTRQPSIKVQASEVSPLDLVLGSAVTVITAGDPFLPDGPVTYRLIGLSGGVGDELTLAMQEVTG